MLAFPRFWLPGNNWRLPGINQSFFALQVLDLEDIGTIDKLKELGFQEIAHDRGPIYIIERDHDDGSPFIPSPRASTMGRPEWVRWNDEALAADVEWPEEIEA